jgi:hypothetical protein
MFPTEPEKLHAGSKPLKNSLPTRGHVTSEFKTYVTFKRLFGEAKFIG